MLSFMHVIFGVLHYICNRVIHISLRSVIVMLGVKNIIEFGYSILSKLKFLIKKFNYFILSVRSIDLLWFHIFLLFIFFSDNTF